MEQAARQFIEKFYREHYRSLYLFACSILGKPSEAEAAVQEAFAAACQKPENFMHSENPVGWIKKAIRYKALHMLEDQKRTASLFMSLELLCPGKEPSCSTGRDAELAEFCKSVVPEDDFAFFLRIANGSSTFLEEAARQGLKLSACYKRFERIRKKLQDALDELHGS